MFDPVVGRFISEDPIGLDSGDTNFYRYVENNTPNAVDPSGHKLWLIYPNGSRLVKKDSDVYSELATTQSRRQILNQIIDAKETTAVSRQELEAHLKQRENTNTTEPGIGCRERLKRALESLGVSKNAKAEGTRIATALAHTLEKNWRFYFPRRNDQRHKGYYCYDWAYGLEDTVKLESSGKYFTVRVESAIVSEPGPYKDRVHFWIRIKSRETGETVYVDDGFWVTKPERIHVHSERPCGGLYEFDLATRIDKPRENANPVTPYGANGHKHGRPPHGFSYGDLTDPEGPNEAWGY